jgi:hypothetical protein
MHNEHATVLAEATKDLPPAQVAEAGPVLVDAARRLEPARLRRLTTHLREVIDPDIAKARWRVRWERRGLWLSAACDGMVAVDGLLDPEAGEAVRSALPGDGASPDAATTGNQDGLAGTLRRAVALLPAPLGAPTQLLDLGRATRLMTPALRRALTVRDGGCIAAGCDRPASWTDAHHLTHWLHGGPTNLDNLVLMCRIHHRAVHEGGWQLGRDPSSGRRILTPPIRRHRSPPAA